MEQIYPTYSTIEVFDSTYTMTKDITLDGAIVECGIAAGSNFAQMIKASIDSKIDREYWGYDSFEGIPFGIEWDKEQPGIGVMNPGKYGVLETTGITAHNITGVIDNLKKWGVWSEKVTLVKGWFQNTVSKTKPDKIAVLRLDGDLYESTKVCLDNLYDNVQKGGLIIIDDYELAGCKKAVDEFLKKRRASKKLQRFSYIAYWYK